MSELSVLTLLELELAVARLLGELHDLRDRQVELIQELRREWCGDLDFYPSDFFFEMLKANLHDQADLPVLRRIGCRAHPGAAPAAAQ